MMAAIEQLLSDWLIEDIIIDSYAVFFNITFVEIQMSLKESKATDS
jgi:hypothetical protein